MDWIPPWVWWVIGLVILREVFAVVFGWDSPWFGETFENAKYNRELYKSGRADKNKVVMTTIDTSRDDINTASGHVETSRVIRGKK